LTGEDAEGGEGNLAQTFRSEGAKGRLVGTDRLMDDRPAARPGGTMGLLRETYTTRDQMPSDVHVAVLLPALNEEATIAEVVAAIPRRMEGVAHLSIIVVDDGSTDGTAAAARGAGAEVVCHRRNLGVGAAFHTGIAAALDADADVIVNMDSDGQFDPADIPALIAPILAAQADMTTCTRFARRDYVPQMPAIKRWGNRMMCRLINRICGGTHYTDVSCGFRAYTRRTAMRLTLFGRFTYTQETFIDLLGKGMTIVEVPLRVQGVRRHGTSRLASNLWTYAGRSFSIILRAARDVRPLAFFGTMGTVLFAIGVILGAIVFGWWLATGGTSPLRNVLLGSLLFLLLGFLLWVLALVADMLGRQRTLLEQVLLNQRMEQHPRRRGGSDAEGKPASGPSVEGQGPDREEKTR
jgi:glycosyltransferase involved in cell wall biosynthesis